MDNLDNLKTQIYSSFKYKKCMYLHWIEFFIRIFPCKNVMVSCQSNGLISRWDNCLVFSNKGILFFYKYSYFTESPATWRSQIGKMYVKQWYESKSRCSVSWNTFLGYLFALGLLFVVQTHWLSTFKKDLRCRRKAPLFLQIIFLY